MTSDIEAEFADLDVYYPGSKRRRREAPEVAERDDFAKPIMKMYRGVDTEFYLLGVLAAALGKSPITLRLWERKAYIPVSPYRLPSQIKDGKEIPGKRVYTRELIDATVEEFGKRNLLGSARVEWKYHDDLTIALVERWSAITN